MKTINNVKFEASPGNAGFKSQHRICVEFQYGQTRYHFWLDENAVMQSGLYQHGHAFPRELDAEKGIGAIVMAQFYAQYTPPAFTAAIVAAIAASQEKRKAEREELARKRAEHDSREALRAAAPELASVLRLMVLECRAHGEPTMTTRKRAVEALRVAGVEV